MMKRYDKMKELTTKEIQETSLDILKDVHEFCVRNGIRYTLAYGTMIGAIRHKGFIPWDDDLDIMMPRPDYERFCRTYTSPRYKVVCKENRKDCLIAFGRVCDTEKTCISSFLPWIRSSEGLGVWIDIFPLDAVNGDMESLTATYDTLHRLFDGSKKARRSLRPLAREKSLSYNINTLKKRLFGLFSRKPESYTDQIISIASRIPYGSTSYVAQLAMPGIVAAYDSAQVESFHLTPFEDAEFFIADGYDSMLRKVYGDYMKLPPEDERVPQQDYIHFYWKTNK